jgi:hypothetical protein
MNSAWLSIALSSNIFISGRLQCLDFGSLYLKRQLRVREIKYLLHLILQRSSGDKVAHALKRGGADGADGLAGGEGLMAGDNYIRKRDEALDDIISNDLAGKILKEQVALLLMTSITLGLMRVRCTAVAIYRIS